MADSCDNRDPSQKDPVDRLFPVLRKQFRNKDFDEAAYNLELLSKARYFPTLVPDLEEITKSFKNFIASLPEKETALKDVDELLQQVSRAIENIKPDEK